jgi:hypothetical protein
MFKRVAHNLAIALMLAISVGPVVRGFNTASNKASGPVVVAVTGTDPEPPYPGVLHSVLAFLNLA